MWVVFKEVRCMWVMRRLDIGVVEVDVQYEDETWVVRTSFGACMHACIRSVHARAYGHAVCKIVVNLVLLRVSLSEPARSIMLMTPTCSSGVGGDQIWHRAGYGKMKVRTNKR